MDIQLTNQSDVAADASAAQTGTSCFKVGKIMVKTSFSDTETTLEDCLKRFLLSL